VITFIIVCLLVAMVPGPAAMAVIRIAIRDGRRSGLLTMLGNEIALVFWGFAAACGLTVLLKASILAFDVLRVAGAVVLIGLGIQAIRHARHQQAIETSGAPGRRGRSFTVGLAANLANPKAAVFAMSFLPPFVGHDNPRFGSIMLLAVVWALVDAAWFVVVIWLIDYARIYLSRPVLKWLVRISGTVMIGLGVDLVSELR
jgi:threonine/homoserine/homoserine lactone efflux protein